MKISFILQQIYTYFEYVSTLLMDYEDDVFGIWHTKGNEWQKYEKTKELFVWGRLFLEIEQNVNIAQYLSFKPKT